MGDLSLKRHAAFRGLNRIASRTVLVAVAALGLSACAYNDSYHRSSHGYGYGYGYGSGARVAVGTHNPGVVYRTHGHRVRPANRRHHAIVPGSRRVVVPGNRYAGPRPGYRRPPHVAPRPPVRPGARPPHAQPRPGMKRPHRHARPESRPRRHHARPPARHGQHARPGHRQRGQRGGR